MIFPICSFDAKNAVLCPQCEGKVETGELTKADVDAYIQTLMSNNGFWDVTPTTLQTISDEISAEFNFTTAQAGS